MSAPTGAAQGTAGGALALVRRHLDAIALEPRPAGGDAERRAREHCARELRALGFTVAERPFEYSALPGRWGTPIGGVLSGATLALAGHLAWRGQHGAALGVLLVALAAIAGGGIWLGRRGVLDVGALRERSVNLEATRGGESPTAWLVAHLDSKSQPVPMVLRVAGIIGSSVAWIAAIGACLLSLAGVDATIAWPAISALGVLAAVPVALTTVGSESPGAVDDASGVATVLAAAAALPAHARVGVLLTSAEELGLAGARAWVRQAAARGVIPGVVLNCDGMDDAGTLVVMTTGAHERASTALRRAALGRGVALGVRRLVPGILVDAVAFSDAGWPAVTLSRGTTRTLARIHTSRDRRDLLDGRGAAEGALVMAEAAAAIAGGSLDTTGDEGGR